MRLQTEWTRWTLNATARRLRRKRNPPTTSNPPGAERGRRKEGWTQPPIQTFSFFCALSSSLSLFCNISMIFEICAHVCASTCVCVRVTQSARPTHTHTLTHPHPHPRPHIHPSHDHAHTNMNNLSHLHPHPATSKQPRTKTQRKTCLARPFRLDSLAFKMIFNPVCKRVHG
jgi:hypothetical protein